jgi:hypothetical protein
MLQTIQEKHPVRKVSSLYCVWTTRDGNPASPLIVVWIDPSMRGFEAEFTPTAESECTVLNAEEPGGSFHVNAASKPESAAELESYPR